MAKDFKSPSIEGRKYIRKTCLEPGDVVVFIRPDIINGGYRTGFMSIHPREADRFVLGVNVYKEQGHEWVDDGIPEEDILFFEATDLEKIEVYKQSLVEAQGWFDEIDLPVIVNDYLARFSRLIKDINFNMQDND